MENKKVAFVLELYNPCDPPHLAVTSHNIK